ncbi:UNVERIFIED_CONTAM: FRG domain-containing protein [Methylobacteriaceae bacterium AG10]|nr:FRG domain-containing protein [Methylobacteriaceae bacterium AG10]
MSQGKPISVSSPGSDLYPRIIISSWNDFLKNIEQFLDGNWIFRGVVNVTYELLPSIGRGWDDSTRLMDEEARLLRCFKREARPHLTYLPADEWEWLAIAQHHGAPTRLIDWSESPMVSTYFAVWGSDPRRSMSFDGGLYIVPKPTGADETARATSPFDATDVHFFYPAHVSRRITAQRGLFTVHPNPLRAYDAPDKRQIVIPGHLKSEFRIKLDSLGFNHATMFPDIDGLARLLAWRLMPTTVTVPDPPHRPTAEAQAAANPDTVAKPRIRPDDPQKGQWGGKSERNGWRLSARVESVETGWFKTVLEIASPDGSKSLTEPVEFFLHDSFAKPKRTVRPQSTGKAKLELYSYGAFTVGARLPDGTELELDLSKIEDAPKLFRSR